MECEHLHVVMYSCQQSLKNRATGVGKVNKSTHLSILDYCLFIFVIAVPRIKSKDKESNRF